MTGQVAELENILTRHNLATSISEMFADLDNQRQVWKDELKELRDYQFAIDTTKTTNKKLPWKNKTTYPKLTQIRDNLHANYMAALFPEGWFRWEGADMESDTREKAEAIEAYLENKIRESDFMQTASKLVYDYIDGNAFSDTEYVREIRQDAVTGEDIPGYIGPRLVRLSPMDIVFNPTAASFSDTYHITRTIKTFGELLANAEDMPDSAYLVEAVEKAKKVRSAAINGHYSAEDFHKAAGFQVDGFGDLQSYFQSPYVEILEFQGDLHDPLTGELLRNHVITIIDRSYIIRKEIIPSWLGTGSKTHSGWRGRPDNLYAMGPLSNLVGMQYRIDHLENLKADVGDLAAFPPLLITGQVEAFDWQPGGEILLDDDTQRVEILKIDTSALNADFQIDTLENRMEEMAGAPKQAMGIRTPGEKTAHEVQTLENAAGRIFHEKVRNFEITTIEKSLNSMLEHGRRNLDTTDVVRVMDDDLGVAKFISITREDITARGRIRAVGASHFAARAKLVQNVQGVFNSPVGQMIAPHISSKNMAKLIEDVLGLEKFQLIKDNAAVFEGAETQRLANQAQEDLEVEQLTPTE